MEGPCARLDGGGEAPVSFARRFIQTSSVMAEQRLSQKRGRILFVEDHPDVREALASLLEDCGYDVTATATAEEAIIQLESAGRFDLIVTDYSMPGQSGAWLLNQAVARGHIGADRGLVVTALPNPPGCEGFTLLTKPLDINTFFDEVDRRLTPARNARAAASSAARSPSCVQLAFYMSSSSAHSHRALKSLKNVLSAADPGTFHLEICDLSQGSHDAAERDKVSYTPTLVKRGPGARSWVVGDLHDHEKLSAVLGAWGIALKPAA